MDRVYECELSKKSDVMETLEADPYSEDSFARAGYKVKEGTAIDEDREKLYIYISASEDFLKKADEKLKEVAEPARDDVQERIIKKIKEEEERVGSGVASIGSMFGED
ncbi:hypothetical protein GF318_01195 [Candidatus Micrarchaeota archaeon]|nr:hypothetical protein [Candidatus Micrarchaeota archaeon]